MSGAFGLIRRRFRLIVELSSVATIVSFLLSAAVLYSMLESIGLSFSAIVSIDDIVISGLALLFRAVFVMIVALPIIYYLQLYAISGVRQRMDAHKKAPKWSFGFIYSGLMLLIATAFLPVSLLLLFATAWSWGAGATPPLIKSAPQWLVIILLMFGYWRVLYDGLRVYRASGNSSGEERLAISIMTDPPGPVALRFYVVNGVLLCAIFASLATYRERISYARNSRDIVFLTPDLASACEGNRARVVWVGVNSVAARCGSHAMILKNVETVGISLQL